MNEVIRNAVKAKAASKTSSTVSESVPAEAEKPAAAEPDDKPAIDPSYYERASKLIDSGEAEEPAPVREPEAKKPAPAVSKSVSADFEDLMKLMEAESNKLKSQLGDNDD